MLHLQHLVQEINTSGHGGGTRCVDSYSSFSLFIYISPQIHFVTPVVLSVHSHVICVVIIVLNVNIFVVILRQNRYVHLNETVKPLSTMKINNNLGM